MKIAEIDLLAYGGFSGLRLDLSRSGALHVVFGTNEAGKSTTLRAVHALLYGIEPKTTDAYLHAYADLRLGARLVAADGRELSFVRRKGSKGTLLDASGAELPEAALARMLSGVTREVFAASFGLDHRRLRQGGEQLRLGRGDLGETLFQAGVGAASIHRALLRLREQHEAIFTPRGKKQLLHDPIEAFEKARKRERDDSVSADAVLKQEEELERLRAEARALDDRRRTCLSERSRLGRALRLLPGLAKREALLRARAELGEVADLPESTEARRTALQQELSLCEHEQAQLAARKAKREQELSQLQIVSSLESERAEVMADLKARLAVQLNAAADLPKRRGELRSIEDKLAAVRRALPASSSEADVDALEVDAATFARFGRIGRERGGLVERVAQAERERSSLRAQLEAARRLLAQLGRTAAESDLDALAASLPTEPAISAFLERFADRERDAARLEEAGLRLDTREETCTAQLDALARSDAPPTEEALRAARGERDASAKALRDAIASTGRAELAAIDALSERIAATDHLGDRMRREAARVAQHAEMLAERAAIVRERERLRERSAQHAARSRALDEQWRAAWAGCGIEPRSPAEMQPMRARLLELLGAGERQRAVELALQRAQADLDAWRDAWAELMQGLGLPADAGAEEAQAVIEKRRELVALAGVAKDLRRRIDAMERNAEALSADARALIERHAPELGELPIERGIERLVELHARSVRDAQQRARIHEDLREIDDETAALVARRAEATRSLEAMVQAAGVLSVEGLEHEERRARRARELARALAEIEDELLEHGDGASLPDLEREARGLAADRVRAVLSDLDQDLERLDEERQSIAQQITSQEIGRSRLQGGLAAEAALEAQAQLARVRALSLEWARKRMAAELLQREIRRYREHNQGPILARAGELFARLTLGVYPRLEVHYDDTAHPVLQCMQGGARAVDVEALSDGARDQLYLALRIASLERFAERSEPLPLLLDDVLVNFDDERASAAFVVLGELAQKMQVLFFTHHAHDLELARAALGRDGVVEHRLARALPLDASAPRP